MTKNLKWRLGRLPTPDEVRELVKDKIITNEEARDILFKTESDEERDKDSFKEEIKFLRELVEKLSQNNRTVVYEYIQGRTQNFPWYNPYVTWCSTLNGQTLLSSGGITNAIYCSGTTNNTQDCAFTAINTF